MHLLRTCFSRATGDYRDTLRGREQHEPCPALHQPGYGSQRNQAAVDAASDGERMLVTTRAAVDKPLTLLSVMGAQSTAIKGHQIPTKIVGHRS